MSEPESPAPEPVQTGNGCEIAAVLIVGTLFTALGTFVLSRVCGLSLPVSIPASIGGFIVLGGVLALTISRLERAAIKKDVARWNGWKCPHCSSNYALKKGDAVRIRRRVYTAQHGQRHTNEDLIRLRCAGCGKQSVFNNDGTRDTFTMTDDVMLVGGNQLEVDIPE